MYRHCFAKVSSKIINIQPSYDHDIIACKGATKSRISRIHKNISKQSKNGGHHQIQLNELFKMSGHSIYFHGVGAEQS